MDPDANWAEQLQIAERMLQGYQASDAARSDSARLTELAVSLDEWINRGGFLPAAWRG